MIRETSSPINPALKADFRWNNGIYQVFVTRHHMTNGVSMNTIVLPDETERKVLNTDLIFQEGNKSNKRFRCIHRDKRVTYHKTQQPHEQGVKQYEWQGLDWKEIRKS